MVANPKVSIDKTEAQFLVDEATYLEAVIVDEIITPQSQNIEAGLLRTVQGRLASAFRNVREDGAAGDGATNDDVALATAFGNGAGLYFMPPGTYLVTGDVSVTAGSVVFAAGVTMSGGALVSSGAFTLLGIGAGDVDTETVTLDGGPTIGPVTGSPEGAVTAPIGSLRLRTDGGANTSVYRKESGAGNTGWVAIGNSSPTARSGATSPQGSVTPDFLGEEYLETTSETWWKAFDVGNTSWRPSSASGTGGTLDDTATPSVAGSVLWTTSGSTTVTDFDDGVTGQVIHLISLHAKTITHTPSVLNLKSDVDYVMAAFDTLTLVFFLGRWNEVARAGPDPVSDGSTLDDTATPSVFGDTLWTTSGSTTVTDFDDGVTGQVIHLISLHAKTITYNPSVINLQGDVDYVMAAFDTLTLVFFLGRWNELARTGPNDDVSSDISSSTPGAIAYFNDTSGKLITQTTAVQHTQIVIQDGSRPFTSQVSGVAATTTPRLTTFGQIVGPGVNAMGTADSPSMTLQRVGTIPASGTNLTVITGGVAGQRLDIIATGARVVEHSTALQLDGDRDYPMESGDTLSLVNDGTNWIERGRTRRSLFVTFSADQATYDVMGLENIKLANAATDVTDFTNGTETQRLTIIATGARVVVDGSNIQLDGATNFSMAGSDSLSLVHDGSNWIEVGRSDTS